MAVRPRKWVELLKEIAVRDAMPRAADELTFGSARPIPTWPFDR
jgi:hypothetical protein